MKKTDMMEEGIKREIIIKPGATAKNYWRDIWDYRELFYILSWRDLKVRYKQTVFGVAWSVIRPVLTTIIFTVVFNRVAKLQAPNDAPYALLVFCGMLPWQFFSNSLSEASTSLVSNANLITKVFFPRLIVPASSIVTSLVDFGVSLALLIVMFFWYSFVPPIHILFLPFFLLLALIASLGVGLIVTALNVKYRDVRFVIPFVIQFGLYITPVGFTSALVPDKWKLLFALNPMVAVIDGFRWCILGEKLNFNTLGISILVSLFFLWAGVKYFRSTERSFADNI